MIGRKSGRNLQPRIEELPRHKFAERSSQKSRDQQDKQRRSVEEESRQIEGFSIKEHYKFLIGRNSCDPRGLKVTITIGVFEPM